VKKYYPIFIIILFFILAAAPSYYFYRKYQTLQKQVTIGAKEDVAALMAKVGKHILLPESETPTVMTVTDKEKLSGQTFFAHAKNGDKVLVYEKAKKAFLYDVAADKIIEVGPVTFDATQSAHTVSPTPVPAPGAIRFFLYNGTTTVGLTKKYRTELVAKVQNAQIVDTDNAKKRNYEKSLLVDITGANASAAAALSRTLGIATSSLPAGESVPAPVASVSADFLIILGKDSVQGD